MVPEVIIDQALAYRPSAASLSTMRYHRHSCAFVLALSIASENNAHPYHESIGGKRTIKNKINKVKLYIVIWKIASFHRIGPFI
jgi:hypothetical protein